MKFQRFLIIALLPGLLFVCARRVTAQSADQNLPTPVLANEITGKISPLDLGDGRVTRHFYAFEGNPGDVLITMDSRNLNGDMDIFTAITFRPLMKTTIYANSQSPEVTKGIYLRTRQILILRVEARTPNDDEGTYRVRFGGTFATFNGGIPVAENVEPESDSTPTRGSKRLSSVGATIAEPVETPRASTETKTEGDTAVKPAEDPEAAKKAEEEKAAADKAAADKAAADKAKATRSTGRNTRGRTPRPVRPKPAKTDPAAAKTSAPKTDEGGEKSADDPAKSETADKPSTQEIPIPGAHLIIESKDGTKIDRPMSTVRRLVVEGGLIIIVLKTGKTERIPMSDVARMAIEP